MPRKIARYGWTPDLPDHRDLTYAAPLTALKSLPPKVDLRAKCPEVYDQGQLGSCTANAIAGAMEFELMKEKARKVFVPSRLFIYYNEREIEGSVREDSGAQIRDGIKSVNKLGAPPEDLWKYSDKNPGPFQKKPTKTVYVQAAKHQVTSYQRVPRVLAQFKGCLASGYPFVFGFTVYTAFESDAVAKTGKLDMPGSDEEVVGGHAVLAVGYDDTADRFIVRNSWGTSWGKKGYFTMPYSYLLEQNLSDDFWTIRTVEA
ncbi:MAG TPA: C1 family peptidase [Polyangiaceae bacterium]|nr:C1 family peptidase [Polyangiaceae bacterium]